MPITVSLRSGEAVTLANDVSREDAVSGLLAFCAWRRQHAVPVRQLGEGQAL